MPLAPRRLLLTLLGDYWWQREEALPSGALVRLLADFDVTDVAARTVLARLVTDGLLTRTKRGRRTFYGLSHRTHDILEDGARELFAFGAGQVGWDGQWSVIVFSIPERDRKLRHAARSQLRWLGFAPLYEGLWVSPHGNLHDAVQLLAGLSITTATAFHARTVEGAPEGRLPQHAWDLVTLRRQYEQFISEFSRAREQVAAGAVTADHALLIRTRAMNHWRSLRQADPELPTALQLSDWPQTRARELFIDVYDGLGPAAERRVQSIVQRHAPELAPLVRHHSVRRR